MGTRSFVQELRSGGVKATIEENDEAGAELIGVDTELTFDKIRRACVALTRDIPFLATHPDIACPTSFGFVPCGANCRLLESATGKSPFFIGKPAPFMTGRILDLFNAKKEDAIIAGDSLRTDIAAGNSASIDTICVLSGESTIEDIESSAFMPAYVLESVEEILSLLRHAKRHYTGLKSYENFEAARL
jgi:ribonucleotide monophosphatase NagD (HAD superfamily)